MFLNNDMIIYTYLPNPSTQAGYDTRSIFKQSLTGLNSEFSFSSASCLTKAEEPSLPYYLPIAGGRIIGFIPFPRVFVLCKMQSVSPRIWTRVTMSISYGDNHYTMSTSSWHDYLYMDQNFYRGSEYLLYMESKCCSLLRISVVSVHYA